MPPPNASFDDLVDYIATGDPALHQPALSWDTTQLTVNLSGLSSQPDMLASARLALQAWEHAAGFAFTEVDSGGDIKFDTNSSGAFTNYGFTSDGTITNATVHVVKTWMDAFPQDQRWGEGDYGMQTFVHEIGHALGLGHPGPYDGAADYDDDAIFLKDTNQYSVMSYFDQSNFGDATHLNVATPMLADLAAIEQLYGEIDVNAGNTSYGRAGIYDFESFPDAAFTIADSGGARDLIDLRGLDDGAELSLKAGSFSDIGGHVKNLAIAFGTTIERAYGTGEGDRIDGNGANNLLRGFGGGDRIDGGGGKDLIEGGRGADKLEGGGGADQFRYASFADITGDFILDFKAGVDHVRLAGLDADANTGGVQDFHFVGAAALEHAGDLGFFYKHNDTSIIGDTDGNGAADFTLHLDHKIALTGGDFLI